MTNILTKHITARTIFAMLAVCGTLLSMMGATSYAGGGGPGVNVNVDPEPVLRAIDRAGNTFCLGPPRTQQIEGAICTLNDWQGRDSRAAAAGRFNTRFSTGCWNGAHWYCYFP
jgi:hypothetical protein